VQSRLEQAVKVKCIKIYNEYTKEYQEKSSSLTIGKAYTVLAIEVYQNRIDYLIVGDNTNKAPTLHRAEQFEIVSNKIPRNWKIFSGNLALFTIEPEAWREPGFWDKCHDGDPQALEIYKREARIILEE
jgi:hypothetical protein